MSIVSESQLHVARNYMMHDVSALLSEVELWVRSGAGRDRESATREILGVLEAGLKRVKALLRQILFQARTNKYYQDLIGGGSEVHNISDSLNQCFQDLVIYDHRRLLSNYFKVLSKKSH